MKDTAPQEPAEPATTSTPTTRQRWIYAIFPLATTGILIAIGLLALSPPPIPVHFGERYAEAMAAEDTEGMALIAEDLYAIYADAVRMHSWAIVVLILTLCAIVALADRRPRLRHWHVDVACACALLAAVGCAIIVVAAPAGEASPPHATADASGESAEAVFGLGYTATHVYMHLQADHDSHGQIDAAWYAEAPALVEDGLAQPLSSTTTPAPRREGEFLRYDAPPGARSFTIAARDSPSGAWSTIYLLDLEALDWYVLTGSEPRLISDFQAADQERPLRLSFSFPEVSQ